MHVDGVSIYGRGVQQGRRIFCRHWATIRVCGNKTGVLQGFWSCSAALCFAPRHRLTVGWARIFDNDGELYLLDWSSLSQAGYIPISSCLRLDSASSITLPILTPAVRLLVGGRIALAQRDHTSSQQLRPDGVLLCIPSKLILPTIRQDGLAALSNILAISASLPYSSALRGNCGHLLISPGHRLRAFCESTLV